MSTGAPTLAQVAEEYSGIAISVPESDQVSIEFRHGDGDRESLIQQQIDEVLRRSLERSGFRQPKEPLEGTGAPSPKRVKAVVVAPGIMVWEDEYEKRYGGIDLERFRQQMPPDLFKAFVRHIGSIPGHPDLDVNELATIPE